MSTVNENVTGCRVSGMQVPAAVEWNTVGKWRSRLLF